MHHMAAAEQVEGSTHTRTQLTEDARPKRKRERKRSWMEPPPLFCAAAAWGGIRKQCARAFRLPVPLLEVCGESRSISSVLPSPLSLFPIFPAPLIARFPFFSFFPPPPHEAKGNERRREKGRCGIWKKGNGGGGRRNWGAGR